MPDVCVNVAVRVRPLLRKEMFNGHRVCVRVVPGTSQVMLDLGKKNTFSYHYAFGPESSQEDVYDQSVRPLLDSLLQGYNVTVFCYGQTGSGKTYTLEGGSQAEEEGLINCVAHDLFCLLDESSEVADYTMKMSYLELYMEELRDLLDLPTSHKVLHIREDERKNTASLRGVGLECCSRSHREPVTSAGELLSNLDFGKALRHTTHRMNDQSSRSHCILTLYLQQRIQDPKTSLRTVRTSILRLVDLAGSERADKTGNTGPRLKESMHINSGLLALGNVIRCLAIRGIPVEASLTFLTETPSLPDCLEIP
ncbi:hypothetical protein WMY93_004710 [Mugilogobius chulae]|uniref:Kinesin motor domain-containing protein n=1 Tax=Mugilogobius chulae TaxID=88201 RepID=A0AAW0PXU1_9GOBI